MGGIRDDGTRDTNDDPLCIALDRDRVIGSWNPAFSVSHVGCGYLAWRLYYCGNNLVFMPGRSPLRYQWRPRDGFQCTRTHMPHRNGCSAQAERFSHKTTPYSATVVRSILQLVARVDRHHD